MISAVSTVFPAPYALPDVFTLLKYDTLLQPTPSPLYGVKSKSRYEYAVFMVVYVHQKNEDNLRIKGDMIAKVSKGALFWSDSSQN